MARRSNRGRNRAPRSADTAARGLYASAGQFTTPPPLPRHPVAKLGHVAPRTPAAIDAAMAASGMDSSAQLGPGRPLSPYQGYSQQPRAMDYPTGVNISTRTRASWGLISFETLRAIVKAYDIARICINHKIDELRSMEPMFQPAEGVRGDVDGAIDAARAALAFPDRDLPYDAWLAKWLENVFKFDAGPLYNRRNRAGDIIGLEVLDGTTILPYIDEHGRRPRAPQPSFYQLIHGQIWNWYTHQDITYCSFRPQEDSPFGTAPMETILLTANTDLRFQWHFLQMFTEGSIPGGFVELPPDISSPDQVAEWQDYWDAMVNGDQAKLHQLIAVPNGTKIINTRPEAFDPTFPEYLMMRTCAAHGIVPQDLGLIKDVNRANGETQTDVQFRVNTLPWVRFVEGTLTRYLQHGLRLPVQIKLNTGRDKEDRLADAQAWKIYIESGMASPDEGRSEILGLPIDANRSTPRFFNNNRLGPIPLPSIEAVAGKTDPETYGPAADQPPLDRPYAGAIGVIPQVGTSDAKASLQAVDAEQQQHRAQLNAQRQASISNVPTVADPNIATVGKAASQALAISAELAAFRRYAQTRQQRGRWRDFEFTAVDPQIAQVLNADGRNRISKKADPAESATAAHGTDATQDVYRQLSQDFPAGHLSWVLDMGWTGPRYVPLSEVNFDNAEEWQAAHEPKRVERFRRKIKAGTLAKPVILVRRPDRNVAVIVDGHHRSLAYRDLNQPIWAYVGHASADTGPWDELHTYQDHDGDGKPDGGKKKRKVAKSVRSWPGWEHDLALTAVYSRRILDGTAQIDADQMARRWMARRVRKAKFDPNDPAWIAAREWLINAGYATAMQMGLSDAFDGLYAEGWALGTAAALGASTRATVDWAGWTPGDRDAADLLLGPDGGGTGLATLLADAGIRIKSLGEGRIDDLARALALSLERGDSADTLARDLRDILDDAKWADMVAGTEIARAVTGASFQTYAANGVEYTTWLSAEDGRVCPYCDENEEAGPVPLGDAFPSGDAGPPGHPRCRCAPMPWFGPALDGEV